QSADLEGALRRYAVAALLLAHPLQLLPPALPVHHGERPARALRLLHAGVEPGTDHGLGARSQRNARGIWRQRCSRRGSRGLASDGVSDKRTLSSAFAGTTAPIGEKPIARPRIFPITPATAGRSPSAAAARRASCRWSGRRAPIPGFPRLRPRACH